MTRKEEADLLALIAVVLGAMVIAMGVTSGVAWLSIIGVVDIVVGVAGWVVLRDE